MIAKEATMESLATAMRREFDEMFASPARPPAERLAGFLAIETGGFSWALRLDEIAAIVSGLRIVPVPTPVTAFAGLAGYRGALLPVYSLGVLLGHGESNRERWVVLVKSRDQLVGLAFERFERLIFASPDALVPGDSSDSRSRVVLPGDRLRFVLSIGAMLETIPHPSLGNRKE